MGKIREIAGRHELITSLIIRTLKVRYKNSALGFFWTLLSPLFMILIYWFFIRLMHFEIDLPSLLTGIIAWQFLVMCVSDNIQAIAGNSILVKKTYFPRIILPFSTVTANFINFLLSLVVLFVFIVICGKINFSYQWIYLPLIIFLHYCLCLGFSLIVACANVYFKDTEHLVSVVLQAWFFLTPIIYPLWIIKKGAPAVCFKMYFLNPMTSIILTYRDILIGSPEKDFFYSKIVFLSYGISLGFFILGYMIFTKYEPYFADEL